MVRVNGSSEKEQFYPICENEKFYYVWGITEHQVKKNSGVGRVWRYFSDNQDTKVSLEKIADISGWKNPGDLMRNRFFRNVHVNSEYQFKRGKIEGKVCYKLSKKQLPS